MCECKGVLDLKIKYHNDDLIRIEKIEVGDWIDLRSAETVTLNAGDFKFISLGVSVQIPTGYELWIAPRGSSYKNFGIIQTNSIGIVDNSYCGDNDILKMPALAIRDTTINFNDRICQFRLVPNQKVLNIIEVYSLENEDRGGFGSTGTN